ncbi:MAG: 2-C-methyl-D-erythritol 4-phosphate cytidylyltransferase [Brachymonas sp.]|nr:2-C-methyl-D-erythritol 4-phosphate cytidylyltransferase [Brachymonas sp.]
MRPVQTYALIPAAGAGSRAGTALPKQYQIVAGQPMLWHTLAAFVRCPAISQTLLVLAPDDSWLAAHPLPSQAFKLQPWVSRCGGASRAESVRNGLLALQERGAQADDWVLVHDAARCLITPEQIQRLISACRNDPIGGLLALPLPDTLKAQQAAAPHAASATPRVAATLPRHDKWLAQTPQMFRLGLLLHALETGLREAPASITDEASAIERQGHAPLLVQGSASNFKVTYPEDFALAEAVLRARGTPPRTSAPNKG